MMPGMMGQQPQQFDPRREAIDRMMRGGQMPMQMPQNSSKNGECLYVNRDLIPGARKGAKVWVLASVGEVGSKIELTPISAQVAGAEQEERTEDQDSASASPAQDGGGY